MRILFLADGRSPIAQSWIGARIEAGHEVHLVSSRAQATPPIAGLASFRSLALFSRPRPSRAQAPASVVTQRSAVSLAASGFALHWLAPLWIDARARRLARIADDLHPDLIHALRLPLEGMVAARASQLQATPRPLVISIWGNDFSLHARASPLMRAWSRRAMRLTHALHTDCARDQAAATDWGLERDRPRLVAPGNGGIRREVFHPALPPAGWPRRWGLPAGSTVFVNPRGLRGYARSDTFFAAIPFVLRELPRACFLCVGMAGSPLAERWVRRLAIEDHVRLLPGLSPMEMAEVFQGAQASISITTHDGTPNTLLEAMACGCFPIAGDLPSLREWITDGENGLLVPAGDPQALARAIVTASKADALRESAAHINERLIAQRAERRMVGTKVTEFYLAALAPLSVRGRRDRSAEGRGMQ